MNKLSNFIRDWWQFIIVMIILALFLNIMSGVSVREVLFVIGGIIVIVVIREFLIPEIEIWRDERFRREGETGTKANLRSTIRKFMMSVFPDFQEEKLSDSGIERSFLIYKKPLEEKFLYILFQTSKWGNGFFVEVGKSKRSDIWKVHGESGGEMTAHNRIGYWRYWSQGQLDQQLLKVKEKIRSRIVRVSH